MSVIIASAVQFAADASPGAYFVRRSASTDAAAATAMMSSRFRPAIYPALAQGGSTFSASDAAKILALCPTFQLVLTLKLHPALVDDGVSPEAAAQSTRQVLAQLPQLHRLLFEYDTPLARAIRNGCLGFEQLADPLLGLPFLEEVVFCGPTDTDELLAYQPVCALEPDTAVPFFVKLMTSHRNERLRLCALRTLADSMSPSHVKDKNCRQQTAFVLVDAGVVPELLAALQPALVGRTDGNDQEHRRKTPLLSRSSNPPVLWESLLLLLHGILANVRDLTLEDLQPILVPALLEFGYEFPSVHLNALRVLSAAGDKREDVQRFLAESAMIELLIKTELSPSNVSKLTAAAHDSSDDNNSDTTSAQIVYQSLRILGNYTVCNSELSKMLIGWNILKLLSTIITRFLGVRAATIPGKTDGGKDLYWEDTTTAPVPVCWTETQRSVAQESTWILSNLAIDCHAELRDAQNKSAPEQGIIGLLVSLAADPVGRKSQKEASIALQNFAFAPDTTSGGQQPPVDGQDIKTVYEQNCTMLHELGLVDKILESIRSTASSPPPPRDGPDGNSLQFLPHEAWGAPRCREWWCTAEEITTTEARFCSVSVMIGYHRVLDSLIDADWSYVATEKAQAFAEGLPKDWRAHGGGGSSSSSSSPQQQILAFSLAMMDWLQRKGFLTLSAMLRNKDASLLLFVGDMYMDTDILANAMTQLHLLLKHSAEFSGLVESAPR